MGVSYVCSFLLEGVAIVKKPNLGGMAEKLVHCFQDYTKVIERLGWKNMDSQEFAQAHLPLLKALAKIGGSLAKSALRKGVQGARFTLTYPEADLLVEKLHGTFRWCRRRLRDAGSGVYLPGEIKAIARAWGKVTSKSKTSQKPTKQDPDVADVKNIRSLFGLPPKKAKEVVSIPDSDDDDDEEEIDDDVGGGDGPKKQPTSSSSSLVHLTSGQSSGSLPSASASSCMAVDPGSWVATSEAPIPNNHL